MAPAPVSSRSVPRPGARPGARPMRVVDPDARARLEALAPRLGGIVVGLGGLPGGGFSGGGSSGGAPGARTGVDGGVGAGVGGGVGAGVGAGVGGAVLAAERVVPVHAALGRVLPQGLVQGTTVACGGGAATSTALLVAAEASRCGAWVGVAGLPALGVQAAVEAGVDVDRVVAVRDRAGSGVGPGGGRDDGTWGQVLAAMIDGFDLVVLGPGVVVRAGTARRVQARMQARGAVLVLAGEVPGFGADLQVVTEATWEGLGDGHGHLRARRVSVQVHGRRVPRPRHDELWFPAADGRIVPVHAEPHAPALRDTTSDVPAPAPLVLERTG